MVISVRIYSGYTIGIRISLGPFTDKCQNGQYFADDIFKRIFFNEKVLILIRTSLKRVPKSSVDNKSALVQIIGLEPMLVYLTDACVTRLHWVTMLLYMMSLITYHHILQYRTLKTWLVIILPLFLLIYFKEKNVVLNTLSHDDLHPMLCADSPPVWPHWCVRNPQWPVRRAAGMLYTHRQISQKS